MDLMKSTVRVTAPGTLAVVTALELFRKGGTVTYVPFRFPLVLSTMPARKFDAAWCAYADRMGAEFPVPDAVHAFADAVKHGASPDVRKLLAPYATQPAAGVMTMAKDKAKAKAKAAPKAKAERKERGPSAASMFQELIMAGSLTNAQIFAKVQAKYGLPDSKKWYVSWYRNYLRKKGLNVPDVVAGERKASASKAKAKAAPKAKAKAKGKGK